MANEQNLIRNEERSPSEARENGRKGGKASGEARRLKKTLKEISEKFMYGTELNDSEKAALEAAGIKDVAYISKMAYLFKAQYDKAAKGDTQAFNAICAIMGEKPADESKVNVSGDLFSKIRVVEDIIEDTGNFPSSEDEIPE